MYLGLFNKERTTHIRKPILSASHALHDRGSIVPNLYLCVSQTEALLMGSNTSYHKHLHGLHRFVYHIFASFTACKRLAVLTHDFGREGSILLCFN
jgi:hypothetical protein